MIKLMYFVVRLDKLTHDPVDEQTVFEVIDICCMPVCRKCSSSIQRHTLHDYCIMELLYCGQERWLCLKGNVSSVSDTSFSAKFTLSNKRPAQYSITQRINELYSAELKYGNNCWSAEAGTAWLSGDEFSFTAQTPWEGEGRTFLFFAFLWKNWVGMKWTNFLGIILGSNVSSARNDHQADKS